MVRLSTCPASGVSLNTSDTHSELVVGENRRPCVRWSLPGTQSLQRNIASSRPDSASWHPSVLTLQETDYQSPNRGRLDLMVDTIIPGLPPYSLVAGG